VVKILLCNYVVFADGLPDSWSKCGCGSYTLTAGEAIIAVFNGKRYKLRDAAQHPWQIQAVLCASSILAFIPIKLALVIYFVGIHKSKKGPATWVTESRFFCEQGGIEPSDGLKKDACATRELSRDTSSLAVKSLASHLSVSRRRLSETVLKPLFAEQISAIF